MWLVYYFPMSGRIVCFRQSHQHTSKTFYWHVKNKIRQVIIHNAQQLNQGLKEFCFYYNHIRPHDYLDGKTPYEVWQGIDVFHKAPKRIKPYNKWDGVLTGERLLY